MSREEMPGLASPAEMTGLRGAGAATDAWFTSLMIDHPAAGADMAASAARLADDPDVKELATRMAKVQRQEIGEMIAAARRAGITIPASGVTWEVYGTAQMKERDHGEQP